MNQKNKNKNAYIYITYWLSISKSTLILKTKVFYVSHKIDGLSNREFESRIKDIQERYDKFANIKDYEESKIFINDKSLQKVVRKVVSAETQTDNAVEIIVPEIV